MTTTSTRTSRAPGIAGRAARAGAALAVVVVTSCGLAACGDGTGTARRDVVPAEAGQERTGGNAREHLAHRDLHGAAPRTNAREHLGHRELADDVQRAGR
jgi:hypothetical protein